MGEVGWWFGGSPSPSAKTETPSPTTTACQWEGVNPSGILNSGVFNVGSAGCADVGKGDGKEDSKHPPEARIRVSGQMVPGTDIETSERMHFGIRQEAPRVHGQRPGLGQHSAPRGHRPAFTERGESQAEARSPQNRSGQQEGRDWKWGTQRRPVSRRGGDWPAGLCRCLQGRAGGRLPGFGHQSPRLSEGPQRQRDRGRGCSLHRSPWQLFGEPRGRESFLCLYSRARQRPGLHTAHLSPTWHLRSCGSVPVMPCTEDQ